MKFLVLAFAVAVATAVTSNAAWSEETADPRKRLAEKIVASPATQMDKEEAETAMLELAARPIFKKIRSDNAWGPEHPIWTKLFPEFCVALGDLVSALPLRAEEILITALAKSLTEAELSEIAATLGDSRFLESLALLRQLGFNSASVMTIAGMVTSPSLYSQVEKDAMKEKFSSLRMREGEMEALKPRIAAAQDTFRTPAFAKYQKVFSDVLAEGYWRLQTSDPARKQLQSFVIAWQNKLKPN